MDKASMVSILLCNDIYTTAPGRVDSALLFHLLLITKEGT
jgi:hypothetical protein